MAHTAHGPSAGKAFALMVHCWPLPNSDVDVGRLTAEHDDLVLAETAMPGCQRASRSRCGAAPTRSWHHGSCGDSVVIGNRR
jgi:hypothetical protein